MTMLTEHDVVQAVAATWAEGGYRVERTCTTMQQGIDIEAVHLKSGSRLLVEARDDTSSKQTTKRYGKGFTRAQAHNHVARAFYTAAKAMQSEGGNNTRIALALPDDDNHRALVKNISSALESLRIAVLLVKADGRVAGAL